MANIDEFVTVDNAAACKQQLERRPMLQAKMAVRCVVEIEVWF